MTFTLYLDQVRWRTHTRQFLDSRRGTLRGADNGPARLGDVVPVAKGNGYGLQIPLLAAEAVRLGVDRIAVGTVFEVDRAARHFSGDILVLQPWDPRDSPAHRTWSQVLSSVHASRIILTISHATALSSLLESTGRHRVVLEGVTSMRRFGLLEPDLIGLVGSEPLQNALRADRIVLEGLALHLPLATPGVRHVTDSPETGGKRTLSGKVGEVQGWLSTWGAALDDLRRAQIPIHENANAVWLSHLSTDELTQVRQLDPHTPLFARIGTDLWLGDHQALSARGTVLEVQRVGKRTAVGYRQRRSTGDGLLLIVSGGTSHGVALQAPTPATNLRQRAIAAGTGALEATGRSRSPFLWGERNLWFAEPPHMQVSMLWLSEAALREGLARGLRTPAIGDELVCRVRHTTVSFDAVQSHRD